jgi:hypothetical protein
VELHAVDVEGDVRDAEQMPVSGGEIALVGDVVDGQHRGNWNPVPAHVSRGQAARPVVGMDDVGGPIQARPATGDIRRGQRQPGESQMIVLPVRTLRRAVRRAAALEQRRCANQIEDRAVGQQSPAQFPGGDRCASGKHAKPVNGGQPGDDRLVCRHQNADIDAALPQRRRQASRYLAQPSGFGEASDLAGNEEHSDG